MNKYLAWCPLSLSIKISMLVHTKFPRFFQCFLEFGKSKISTYCSLQTILHHFPAKLENSILKLATNEIG